MRGRSAGWLRRLGTISFSVYLVQALVLIAVPRPALPASDRPRLAGVVLAVSEVTYRLVEQPSVRLGRRLGAGATGRRPPRSPPIRSLVPGAAVRPGTSSIAGLTVRSPARRARADRLSPDAS